jgi:hypothetical protein
MQVGHRSQGCSGVEQVNPSSAHYFETAQQYFLIPFDCLIALFPFYGAQDVVEDVSEKLRLAIAA